MHCFGSWGETGHFSCMTGWHSTLDELAVHICVLSLRAADQDLQLTPSSELHISAGIREEEEGVKTANVAKWQQERKEKLAGDQVRSSKGFLELPGTKTSALLGLKNVQIYEVWPTGGGGGNT